MSDPLPDCPRVPPSGMESDFTVTSLSLAMTGTALSANVTFPGGSGPDAVLPVAVEDAAGNPINAAVLEFAGQDIAIRYGSGELRYADFIKGKHEKAIWLRRRGVNPVPGSLTFA